MKYYSIKTAILICFTTSVCSAQSLFDKLDKLSSKVNNATNSVERSSNSANKAADTGSKITSLFGKKNKDTGAVSSKTVITINNADLSKVKTINSSLQKIQGVSSSEMKYSAEKSTITVLFAGSSDNLLEKLQQSSSTPISDKNIQSIESGKIILDLSK